MLASHNALSLQNFSSDDLAKGTKLILFLGCLPRARDVHWLNYHKKYVCKSYFHFHILACLLNFWLHICILFLETSVTLVVGNNPVWGLNAKKDNAFYWLSLGFKGKYGTIVLFEVHQIKKMAGIHYKVWFGVKGICLCG